MQAIPPIHIHGNAIGKYGVGVIFFDTFSSRSEYGTTVTNDYEQSCSIDLKCCYFTGKERDKETGYGYFGARYMDYELMTSFISVDRYADKYPFISPYAYSAWNPIQLLDPTGDTIECVGNDKEKLDSYVARFRHCFPDKYKKMQESSNHYIIKYTAGEDDGSGGNFTYNPETECFEVNIKSNRNNTSNGYTDMEVLSHELKHAEQYEDGDIGFMVDYDRHNPDRAISITPIAYDVFDEIEAAKQANRFANPSEKTITLERNTRFKYSKLDRIQTSVKDYIESYGHDIYRPETYNTPVRKIIHNVK